MAYDRRDPFRLRGKRFYAVVGTQLPIPGKDPASYEAACLVEAKDASEAAAYFIQELMIGDVYEVTPSEYPAWHNFVQSYVDPPRLTQPTSGVWVGGLGLTV